MKPLLFQLKDHRGILFIVWGWTMFYSYFTEYVKGELLIVYPTREILSFVGYAMGIIAVLFTIYFLIHLPKPLWAYHQLLKYIWLSILVGLVTINLVMFNVLHEVMFELQHPVFMVFIAFGVFVTGLVLKYWPTIVGGVFFAVMAYLCSLVPLHEQMLVESAAWVAAFIIPGHMMAVRRFNLVF